ncbi:hypothetical protein SLS62_006741 [Diatrype stigma]|uniref:Hemerythrin-like domain-containing protein n=1 Tax=Diatrype stigma TaxID=117547 RepID=A0AAN9UMS7_9PEZI
MPRPSFGKNRSIPSLNAISLSRIAPTSSSRTFRTFGSQNIAMASEPSSSESATNPPCPPDTAETTQKAQSDETTTPEQSAKPKLPPLTDHEFRQYNRLAEHMDLFHNHFRSTWNMLWGACTSGKRPGGMSLKAFIGAGLQFVQQLEMHHNIEETYIFPVLAKKMPEFRSGKGNGAAELLRQHKEIHRGLETLQEYLRKCKSGETELELRVLKTKLEGWGTVLWTHLDQEVETLGAENMRQYWTVDEIRRIPM